MTSVRVESFTISLDGYGAGPDQSLDDPLGVGGTQLHQWLLPTRTLQRTLFGKDGGSTGVDDDFAARLEYIHYNPVKHGWVSCPHAWPYSSFSRWVREGRYPADWQCRCAAQHVMPSAFDHIARTVGE